MHLAACALPATSGERKTALDDCLAFFVTHGWAWAGFPAPKTNWRATAEVLFRNIERGFVTRLALSSAGLFRVAAAQTFFGTQPIADLAFEVGTVPERSLLDVRRLLPLAWPVRVTVVRLAGSGDSLGFVTTLLNSAVLTSATELSIEGFYAGRTGWPLVCRLTRSPFLRALRVLNLKGSWLSDQEAADLAHCRWFAHLEELSLSGNRIGDRGAAALSDSPHLRRLKKLDLTRNALTADAHGRLKARFGTRVAM